MLKYSCVNKNMMFQSEFVIDSRRNIYNKRELEYTYKERYKKQKIIYVLIRYRLLLYEIVARKPGWRFTVRG